MKKKNLLLNLLFSNFFLLFILILTAFLTWSLFKQYNENSVVESDIELKKQEIRDLEKSNQELNELIEYFSSDLFIEKEARDKLGLRKDGEKVVVIPKETDHYNDQSNDLLNQQLIKEDKFLPKLWWEYFFY